MSRSSVLDSCMPTISYSFISETKSGHFNFDTNPQTFRLRNRVVISSLLEAEGEFLQLFGLLLVSPGTPHILIIPLESTVESTPDMLIEQSIALLFGSVDLTPGLESLCLFALLSLSTGDEGLVFSC